MYLVSFLWLRDPVPTNSASILDLAKERNFIVFESKLRELFEICPGCAGHCLVDVNYVLGTIVTITRQCPNCGIKFQWSSQPYIKSMPAGNLMLSASIFFAGALPTISLRIFEIMNIPTHSRQTYHNQRRNIWPQQLSVSSN